MLESLLFTTSICLMINTWICWESLKYASISYQWQQGKLGSFLYLIGIFSAWMLHIYVKLPRPPKQHPPCIQVYNNTIHPILILAMENDTLHLYNQYVHPANNIGLGCFCTGNSSLQRSAFKLMMFSELHPSMRISNIRLFAIHRVLRIWHRWVSSS